MEFINRNQELKFLENQYEDRPGLVILYGRRRVGKTALVKKFCENKNKVYYTATETNEKEQLEEIYNVTQQELEDNHVKDLKRSWETLLRYLKDKDLIFVIDEFPYVIKANKSIPSIIQRLWDKELKNSNMLLILTGSSVSMMEDKVLSHNSPLYGRRSGQWKLEPFKFRNTSKFFPNYSIKDKIRAYSILGGVPYFLEQFNPKKSIFKNINNKILSRGSVLYNEPEFLMRIEFREPKNYYTILRSLSQGNTEFNEIKNNTGITKNNLTSYLSVLRNLDIIKRITPITRKNSKKGKYYIQDNFLKFWFRYILPNKSQLETNKEILLNKIKKDLNQYVSQTFEEICREYISLSDQYEKYEVGKWWYKENEIDIVALNQNKKEILLGECKWTNKKTNKKTFYKLKEKAEKVRWNQGGRTEKYCIFSKSGFKDELKEISKNKDNLELYNLTKIKKEQKIPPQTKKSK